jgi:hypothetical protein
MFKKLHEYAKSHYRKSTDDKVRLLAAFCFGAGWRASSEVGDIS